MSRFLQLHILTAYPPSNPNRDDLGRPKTAILGGHPRMRISSQAIKRAIRTSDVFVDALGGYLGSRTQRIGEEVRDHLTRRGVAEESALEIARRIAGIFGKIKIKKERVHTEQLAFVSPEERTLALELAEKAAEGEALPKDADLAKAVLRTADTAADIAMFGRMLADNPAFNREAAVQVAHAISTNRVEIEDDYYTAVDDLKRPEEDAGAGFVGEAGFGAAVFYLYICVNRQLLIDNLGGNRELAGEAIKALVKAATTASPSGKRNSFANHVRAEYVLAERGDAQPRTLASAFLVPVGAGDQMRVSIERLNRQRDDFARAYGRDWDADAVLDVRGGVGTIDEIAAFAADALPEGAPAT